MRWHNYRPLAGLTWHIRASTRTSSSSAGDRPVRPSPPCWPGAGSRPWSSRRTSTPVTMSGNPWSPPTISCSTGSVSCRRWRTPGSSTRMASDGLPRGRRSGSSWPSAPQTLSRPTPLAPIASTSSGTPWICCCSGMPTRLGPRSYKGYRSQRSCSRMGEASGRRCFLAKQLGLKRKYAVFNQYAIWSWFRRLGPEPEGHSGYVFFHFLGLERAWAWQIPLRHGITSVGGVTDKRDFQKSGKSHEEFFDGLVVRNPTFELTMREAERVRPWYIEADYSYQMETGAGPGWLLIGDAFRFVDPILSSGVDGALHSAELAYEAITASWRGTDETEAFAVYERNVNEGVDSWYDTVDLFYKLQQLFGRFATDRRYAADVARALQGNPYDPVNRERTRRLLDRMWEAYEGVMADPQNLLRAGALDPKDQEKMVTPDDLKISAQRRISR